MNYKLNQRVFDIRYGWGTIVEITNDELLDVLFDSYDSYYYTLEGKPGYDSLTPTLSFTEYTLLGFSNKPVPKVGDLVKIGTEDDAIHVGFLYEIEDDGFHINSSMDKSFSSNTLFFHKSLLESAEIIITR